MGTRTPEEIQAIPGAISSAELFSEAVRTNKKIKYYVISRRTDEVLIRYMTPNGNATNGKGSTYKAKPDVPRFTNYWYAYAHRLKVLQQEDV